MILIYKYDASIYCDWLTEMIIYIGKSLVFSYYAARFPTELYESCIMSINFSSIFIHKSMIKDITKIPYYLGQPLNRFKGNKSVGESGKVNLTILYRYELGPEKQAITQK